MLYSSGSLADNGGNLRSLSIHSSGIDIISVQKPTKHDNAGRKRAITGYPDPNIEALKARESVCRGP